MLIFSSSSAQRSWDYLHKLDQQQCFCLPTAAQRNSYAAYHFSEVYSYLIIRPLLAGFDLHQFKSHNIILSICGKSMDFLHSESLPAQGLDLLPLLLADITAFSPAGLLWQQPVPRTVTTLHRNQAAPPAQFYFPSCRRAIWS